ncbi:hypothetical protein CsSME_00024993 [Camellia sinensis var. sinensis]
MHLVQIFLERINIQKLLEWAYSLQICWNHLASLVHHPFYAQDLKNLQWAHPFFLPIIVGALLWHQFFNTQ